MHSISRNQQIMGIAPFVKRQANQGR